MKRTGHEEQFSYDESLLHEGKYAEWFWGSLDERQIEYLNAPVVVPHPPEQEPVYKNQEFPQAKRWRDKASCAGVDPVVFFGSESADLKKQYADPNAEWRSYCPECPVRELCLEMARKSKSIGIFGGHYFTFENGWNGQKEFTEETLPKKGRPKTNPLTYAERCRRYREKKKANARISTA